MNSATKPQSDRGERLANERPDSGGTLSCERRRVVVQLSIRLVLGALVLCGAGNLATAAGLDLACTLPFDSIKRHHAIDDSCANRMAKNNFCATGNPTS